MLLNGIRVIEHATYIAAPGAGGVLADWGAEVIKIEPPGGDPIRSNWPTTGTGKEHLSANPCFDADNRGKTSIVVDARTAEGQAVIRRLAAQADVFLTNVRPGGLERSGLDHASLSAVNPKLIYCAITGYGLEGPDAGRPGFDIASYWSRSGLARLSAPKGAELFPLRTAVGDHTASITAVAAICAALIDAARTGKGRLIDVSLLRTAMYTAATDLAIQLFFGRIASTKPRMESPHPLSNFFRTKDDAWICLVPRTGEADLPRVARALDLPEILTDPRFAGARARREHGAAIIGILDEAFARFTLKELAPRLDAEELVWAPAQTLAEAAADPQVTASGAIVEMPSQVPGETFASPASPARFVGLDDGPKGPGPKIGEHTRQILEAAGYPAEEIERLFKAGAVA